MCLDHSGVLTSGMLVPKEDRHNLLHSTLLVIPPGVDGHQSALAPLGISSGLFPCNTWSTRHTLAGWLQT